MRHNGPGLTRISHQFATIASARPVRALRERIGVAAVTALLGCAAGVQGQTSYPMVTRVLPTAAQRGKTMEITVSGTENFAGAYALLCEGTGLRGEVLGMEAPAAKAAGRRRGRPRGAVKARLTVAPDAPLGPREVRVATPQGVSSLGLVVIVDDPVVAESDDRSDDQPSTAQPITLPCVISGTIGKPEDVDWYAVPARAGQRLTFSVWANRLENKIHDLQAHFDPILSIHDAQGRELAVDDNHDFADPMLSYQFKDAGTYYLQIRDTTYTGNANWTYVLQATGGPYVTSVFPMAVNPGSRATLHAKGFNVDERNAIALDVPRDIAAGPWLTALPTAGGASLATPLVVTTLPLTLEAGDAATSAVKSQAIEAPFALSGRLGEPNDIDSYLFHAKKGQGFVFEVVARRAGAATDPVLKILNVRDSVLNQVDDNVMTKDPRLEWAAPADGVYAVQITDLHSRGGDDFGYVLLVEPSKPAMEVYSDPDKVNVGPGGRVPIFVEVARHGGFSGPVTFTWSGLPAGVTASPLTIAPTMSRGVIVVSAAPDAKHVANLVNLAATGQTPQGPIHAPVLPKQEIYLPGGGRAPVPVNTLALGVTDPSDITVDANPSAITLAPGGTATIDVTVTRNTGFDKGVNLAIVLEHLGGIHGNPLPPGVTVREAGSKTLLGPKETVGKIILEAKPDAPPCDDVPIAVMGHVSINFVVKTAYASGPILVTVPPRASAAK